MLISGVPLPSITPRINAFLTSSSEANNVVFRFGISVLRSVKPVDSKNVLNPGRRFFPESKGVPLILSFITVYPPTLLPITQT